MCARRCVGDDRAAMIAAFGDAAINTCSTTWRNLFDVTNARWHRRNVAHPDLDEAPLLARRRVPADARHRRPPSD
jgi:hypothetical protein